MFETMRRRIALRIAPELATFKAQACRPEPVNEQAVIQRALADEVRAVASVFFAAGCELPVWRSDREWLEGLGFHWSRYTAVRAAITRLVRDEASGVKGPTHAICLRLLSTCWPVGVEWPPTIPRPTPSKDAA